MRHAHTSIVLGYTLLFSLSLVALASGGAIGDDRSTTGTPFPLNARVAVTTPAGQYEGFLQKSKASGWISIQEYDNEKPLVVRLGEGVTLREVDYDRDATISYWEQASAIMAQLYKLHSAKPNSKQEFPGFGLTSSQHLLNAKAKLKALNDKHVDKLATSSIAKLVDAMEYVTGDGSIAAQLAAGAANYGNLYGAGQAGTVIDNRRKELINNAYKSVNTTVKTLSKIYDKQFSKIQTPLAD